MRDIPARRWLGWRLAPNIPAPRPPAARFVRRPLVTEPAAAGDVRHDLVARVRAEIAAGLYDPDGEKFAAAEEALLRRLDGAW